MTKADLKQQIADQIGVSKKEAGELLELVLGSMVRALQDGDSIAIRGLGCLYVRTRRARLAHNPRTGQKVKIPARQVVAFRLSPRLLKAMDGGS